ncbi:septum site-determining protein Ssd [Actinocrispum wychmicini]|uniref:Secretion/DNA translocation related CpaE-like protein n=1 Tax=Actinocrispum wychmicini TaxID=1213861 RepID=A0A4R2JYG6_9PSEU|nr:septum site-determining protein Ssd [Actinocrispum wychmicini]TCO64282.1 secretion/DNA translocation related CpaE-like protein [Actinocrispum wychmicini]
MAKPLVLANDETVLDELLRLAAAAGCAVERVSDVPAARQLWHTAPLVFLDPGGARDCHAAGLPSRDNIIIVSPDTTDVTSFKAALALHAQRVIELPVADSWLSEVFADAAEGRAGPPGRVVAVIGGRGGAGASVFASAVAVTAARGGHSTMLVDCDPLAGGLDLLLGMENDEGPRWPDIGVRSGRVASSALRAALPSCAGVKLLSGARKGFAPEPEAVTAVVSASRRGGDVVVCDLPRDMSATVQAALSLADLTVIVVPAEVRACMSAARVAEWLGGLGASAQVLVRGPAPGGLSAEEVAKAVDLPLLSWMPYQRGLATSLEKGTFVARRGPLAAAARRTLETMGVPA